MVTLVVEAEGVNCYKKYVPIKNPAICWVFCFCVLAFFIYNEKENTQMAKKYLNLDQNILLEWEYSSLNITENYTIWSDLTKNTRNFVSTTNLNDIDHNLFVIDPVSKKYSKIDPTQFNFLKIQNYSTAPVLYDKVTLYFPNQYDFGVYYGFYLKVQALDYLGKNIFPLSNFYFDKSQAQSINGTMEYAAQLMQLPVPFIYNQKEWSMYLTYYVPSVYTVGNQRLINPNTYIVLTDSINDHLTNGVGLNLSSPIYLEFSFITAKQTVFSIPYYYMGDTYKASLSLQPEYQTLGVMIQESTQGDFFEIYGVYNNSNENMDNFVNGLESQGRSINIEYVVTLYEENLISGYPVTFLVTENFAQMIEYRPIIKYSNTTAAIDVEMKIIDLVDNSSFSRFASIGLTSNLLKYGKTLARLSVDNLSTPTIYNYKYDKVVNNLQTSSSVTDINLVKVPFPILINNYKILASNYNPTLTTEYKGMGLLNIILTPFDNVIKFQMAKQDSATSPVVPYDLTDVLLSSTLNLVFQSSTKTITKNIYFQTDENNFSMGIVVFKVNQEDIPIIKQINKEKSDNFYITLNSNYTSTLLYSGKFKIFENLTFLNVTTTSTLVDTGTTTSADLALKNTPNSTGGATTADAKASAQLAAASSGGVNDIIPPQFDANGIPILQPGARGTLDSYRNVMVWIKAGLTTAQVNQVVTSLSSIGVNISYAYQTPSNVGTTVLVLDRVEIAKLQSIAAVPNVDNVKDFALDFGWQVSTDKTINFANFGSQTRLVQSAIATKANKNNSSNL